MVLKYLDTFEIKKPSRSRRLKPLIQVGAGNGEGEFQSDIEQLLEHKASKVGVGDVPPKGRRTSFEGASQSELNQKQVEQEQIKQQLTSVSEALYDLKGGQKEVIDAQIKHTGDFVKVEKSMWKTIKELQTGNLSIKNLFTTGMAALLKTILLSAVQALFWLINLIYWKSWVYPIKYTIKKVTDKFVCIGGMILITCIGGILYAHNITSDNNMCNMLPQAEFCGSLLDVGSTIFYGVFGDLFQLEWQFDSVYEIPYSIIKHSPPLIMVEKGKHAFAFIGTMYVEAIKEYLKRILLEAIRETGRSAATLATEIPIVGTVISLLM